MKFGKKRERLSTGLGYDPDNKIEVFVQFFKVKGGLPIERKIMF